VHSPQCRQERGSCTRNQPESSSSCAAPAPSSPTRPAAPPSSTPPVGSGREVSSNHRIDRRRTLCALVRQVLLN
jgi:hypothetical protein